MWKDDATAQDLLLAARAVREFVQEMTRDQFMDDFKTQCAVLQQIIVLGEAAKRLSRDFRAGHPSIPWQEIAGMRDRCVHGYDNINLQLVWEVTQTHAPLLADYLGKILPEPPSET
jgi:uncharacterized protein with HEPN domain